MTEFVVTIGIALVLLVLLFFALSERVRGDDFLFDDDGDEGRLRHAAGAFPAELVRRVFSAEDWQFVASLESPPLLRFYRVQRRTIALHWVRQVSRELSHAIRAHASAASTSANLKVASELRLFFRYAALRLLCRLLILSMAFVDLHVLLNMAIRANSLAADFLAGASDIDMRSRPAASSPTLGAL